MADMTTPARFYSAVARQFHWWTVAFVLVMIPTGLWMAARAEANLFDDFTNRLYDIHKLTGFLLLWLVLSRLIYRLAKGAPPSEPTLTAVQKGLSHAVHWLLYGLLIVVPVLGWLGVSLYPALGIGGLFSLPALTSPDQAASERVLSLHKTLALVTIGLIAVHLAAALFHRFVVKDGFFQRMWPGR